LSRKGVVKIVGGVVHCFNEGVRLTKVVSEVVCLLGLTIGKRTSAGKSSKGAFLLFVGGV
jgi:hypothetical protein